MNRRHFIKISALNMAGIALIPSFNFAAGKSEKIFLIVNPDDRIVNEPSVHWALTQFRDELLSKKIETLVVPNLSSIPAGEKCIVVSSSDSKIAASMLKAKGTELSSLPESLAMAEGKLGNHSTLLVCGNDPRGIVYSLLELTDRIHYSISPFEAMKISSPVSEHPANKVRSIYRCFASEIEDKSWFYDREFWLQYLTMLAVQRFNRFQLAFGMGYNTPDQITDSYFLFAYPFLLKVPGYDVRIGNLPDEERERNLEMLKFISEETELRGIEFQLGLWSHGIDWKNSPNPNYPLLGINSGNQAPYCRDALIQLLKECPAISGITFRVHGESGVPEGDYVFWQTLFEAFKKSGRKIRIDMHAKNVTEQIIEIALATGMDVTLSPKYWAEHQGLGYIPSSIRSMELGKENYFEQPSGVGLGSRGFTRYSYGDYFREDRKLQVLHRIWPGTQHLLLSGDPVLSSAYGRVSGFCGALGYDLPDPLTFKGRRGTGHEGGRCGYGVKALEPKYDWQKFSYTYRTYGRTAYNPETDPDVWKRFLRAEFGSAAEAVEKSLSSASRILPMITTIHGPSADCSVYWPEIYTNMSIINVDDRQPYKDMEDPKVFGNVSSLDPQLFAGINEFADLLLAGNTVQKYTPVETAQMLEELSFSAMENLNHASYSIQNKDSVEFKRLAADVRIQSGLAQFFASKIRSALLWRIFEKSGDINAFEKAADKYRQARDAWKKMIELTETIYVIDISFGDRKVLRENWGARLEAIDQDVSDMEKKLAESKSKAAFQGDRQNIEHLIQAVLASPKRTFAVCKHTPVRGFKNGEEVKVKISVPPDSRNVNLYYRHVNQALRWLVQPMQSEGNTYQGTIPSTYTQTKFPLQYYFGMDTEKGPAIFPGLDEHFMNQPYYVMRLSED
jgi:hypothetical protein